MKRRRSESEDLRIVRQLARESAELPTPEVDWARMEARLLRAVDGETATAAHVPRRAWRSWSSALAVAALVAMAWWTERPQHPLAQPASSGASAHGPLSTVREGDGRTVVARLRVGDVVDSGSESFHYQMPGVVSFTLAANTEIEVLEVDEGGPAAGTLTLGLHHGAVHAEVIHRNDGEAFGVEVGSTRVAVHGTSFTVTREGDRALVDVTRGSVAVGPVGHRGSTQGWLVVGPDRASFSLDGATDVRWLGTPASSPAIMETDRVAPESLPVPTHALPSKALRAPAAHEPSPAAPALDPSVPAPVAKLSPEAIEHAQIDAILHKLGACYTKQATSLGMRFSVDTMLTLTLYPNGNVRQGVFDPPLSPTLMRCASDAINEARFAPSASPVDIRLPVHLARD